MERYEPTNQWQGRPDDADGWVSCGAYSCAVIADAATLGGCLVSGHFVRSMSNEKVPNPKDPGLDIPQLVNAMAAFGISLENRTGQRKAGLMADLRADRYLSVSTWYTLLGGYRSQKGNTDWGHQITIGRLSADELSVKIYDPLSKIKTGRWIPVAVIVAAMVEWGRRIGLGAGQMAYARSRRVPFLAVA